MTMGTRVEETQERVLVLAPIGRDAQAAAQQLAENRLTCVVCTGIPDLHERLKEGAAAALVTEEALLGDGVGELGAWVADQPAWSDFPFVVLTSHVTSASAHLHRLRLLENLGNVSLLERPLGAVTLVSGVRAALRARRRQYEVRGHLVERDRAAAQLEDMVRERTRQLEETNQQLRRQIIEREQAQAALQQAQKMEVVGQMTGGLAHDFNNLLTAVLGNLELATRRTKDDGIRRYLDGATQAARRGSKLTSQLLAFARTQRLQMEATNLNTLITSIGDLLHRTIGATVRIETVLEKDLWTAMVDPSQIELIILNLAINARDAMPDGGRVIISTTNVRLEDCGQPAELMQGDYVGLSVSDTGTGMTEEVLKKAYEPFFTTKGVGRGTGLGLSQVYGIAKQSGGGVRIDTKLGKGTTVTVYLPRTERVPAGDNAPDNTLSSQLAQHRATVLVVDDDRDVREVTVACLESVGYRVLAAEGGRAALDIVGGNTPVDLLLLDIAMPEMNGPEAARAIVSKRPGLPIIYMTGYVGSTQLSSNEQQRLVKKPFTVVELTGKVEEALSTAQGQAKMANVVSMRPASRT
jgi:signal transduction histidine kinase/CheY-like chemotaxis protein